MTSSPRHRAALAPGCPPEGRGECAAEPDGPEASCCNASLDDVSAAVVAPDPTNDPVTENGFPKWVIPAVIGAGVVASIAVFVAAFAMAMAYR